MILFLVNAGSWFKYHYLIVSITNHMLQSKCIITRFKLGSSNLSALSKRFNFGNINVNLFL